MIFLTAVTMKFLNKDLYFHIFKTIWTKQARFYESADGLRLYFQRLPKKSKKLISQICKPGKKWRSRKHDNNLASTTGRQEIITISILGWLINNPCDGKASRQHSSC